MTKTYMSRRRETSMGSNHSIDVKTNYADHSFNVIVKPHFALYIILSRDYMVSFDWTKSPAV